VAGSEIPEGLNDIIRREAEQRGLPIADVYEPFQDRASELLSGDFIHPNDAGYRVMADVVIATLED
jgi:lysophospholipase L1-like esterase